MSYGERCECNHIIASLSPLEVIDFIGAGGRVSPERLREAVKAMERRDVELQARRVAKATATAQLAAYWVGATLSVSRAQRSGPPLGFHPDRRLREHRIVPHKGGQLKGANPAPNLSQTDEKQIKRGVKAKWRRREVA